MGHIGNFPVFLVYPIGRLLIEAVYSNGKGPQ